MTGDLSQEMQQHLDEKIEALVASGMPREEAIHAARRAFGNATLLEQRSREVWMWPLVESLWADVKFALRQLRKSPGFAITAILTLALGIGAATGIFSILNAWIFQPLPLKSPQQLDMLWRSTPANPSEPAYFFAWRDYLYFREHSHAFSSLGASFWRAYALTGSGAPESLDGEVASQTFFGTLGVVAYRGRLFLPQDETGTPVAVISHAFWTKRFHQSLDVLGKTLTLNDKPFKVIGVLPARFSYRVLDQPGDAAVWTLIQAGDPDYKPDSESGVALVGRLRPGVTIAQAQSEMSLLQKQNDQRYADSPKTGTLIASLQQDNTRTVRSSLLVLGSAVGLLLLIACTNVASLILGRNAQREREFAIRTALGSSARRLLLQLTIENLVLYGISGILGLLIAYGSVRGFVSWNPFGVLPARAITVSLPVLGIAAVLTLISGVFFGAYPAFKAARARADQTLRLSMAAVSAGRGQLRSRSVIVLMQIALSLVLLVGTYLLLTTFLKLNAQPLGFRIADTHVIQLSLPQKHYGSDDQRTQFSDELLRRFRALPGVESAGTTLFLRLADAGRIPFQVEGQQDKNENHLPQAVPVTVGPGYFEAMGIPLLSGRAFADSDLKNTRPVAILNEESARRYFGNKNPIGEHIRIGDPKSPDTAKSPWLEVVGVVGSTKSVRYNQIAWKTRPEMYTDYHQQQIHQSAGNWDYTRMAFIVRTRPGVSLSIATIRQAVWSVDPDLPVGEIRSLGDMVDRLQSEPRVRARLLTIFAALALLMAAIGIYGVMAQSVTQRYREIGIRMALGADRGSVVLLVLKQGLVLAITGIALGLGFAIVAVRLMKSLLYGITLTNPTTYFVVAAVVLVVALVASLLPARRAASVDPVQALRSQ